MSENSTLVQNLHFMLKHQYFTDVQSFNQDKKNANIAHDDLQITYSDIVVWFSNKDCSETLELSVNFFFFYLFSKETNLGYNSITNEQNSLIRYIYKVVRRAGILLYQIIYKVNDKYNKFVELLSKLKHIEKVMQRTDQLQTTLTQVQNEGSVMTIRSESENKEMELVNDQVESVDVILSFKFIEENENIVFEEGVELIIEITYGNECHQIKGERQLYSNKVNFNESSLVLRTPYDIGTLQMNLVSFKNNIRTILASRNLDPLTSLKINQKQKMIQLEDFKGEQDSFPLQVTLTPSEYLKLHMDVNLQSDYYPKLQALLVRRIEYLRQQYDKNYKICYLYKAKLRLLLKPFELVKFDDDGLYFQKIKKEKPVKSCNSCNIF